MERVLRERERVLAAPEEEAVHDCASPYGVAAHSRASLKKSIRNLLGAASAKPAANFSAASAQFAIATCKNRGF